ncbi:MAG: FAD-dependent thymidylate synthase [Rhodobacteraceae bacterium]|nr:FAD-dependent thymidylate synthase [Paracoccaceae bacterium]
MKLTDEQEAEIESQRTTTHSTRRVISPGIEDILFSAIPVLDHGFIRVTDYMGCDESIVQAARVSYGTGTKKTRNDEGLIRFLMRHRHTTPFEMCEIKLHVKLPLFVARQWIRHRTASVNEYSARYSKLDNEFYIPAPEHLSAQSTGNRQGRGEVLAGSEAEEVLRILRDDCARNYAHYEHMLNAGETRQGLARELARMNLPANVYTQWYWKIDLHNLLHFILLRNDPHAQYEIRCYAGAIEDVVRAWCPIAWQAYKDYMSNASTLSARDIDLIKRRLRGEDVTLESSGLTRREWTELLDIIDLTQ